MHGRGTRYVLGAAIIGGVWAQYLVLRIDGDLILGNYHPF